MPTPIIGAGWAAVSQRSALCSRDSKHTRMRLTAADSPGCHSYIDSGAERHSYQHENKTQMKMTILLTGQQMCAVQ